jgi:hypothetical protein
MSYKCHYNSEWFFLGDEREVFSIINSLSLSETLSYESHLEPFDFPFGVIFYFVDTFAAYFFVPSRISTKSQTSLELIGVSSSSIVSRYFSEFSLFITSLYETGSSIFSMSFTSSLV